MSSLTLELSQKTGKTMFLNKFSNIPSILNLSLPLFLGQIPNLIMPPYVIIIDVWSFSVRGCLVPPPVIPLSDLQSTWNLVHNKYE